MFMSIQSNHGYDALAFLKSLPTERIAYGHVAGHYRPEMTAC